MAEEQNAQNSDGVSTTPTDGGQDENSVSVDRAELEALRASAKRIEVLDGYAKEAQMDDAESYFNTLEDTVFNAENNTASAPSTPEAPPLQPEDGSQVTAMTKEQENAIAQATSAANNALLQVQLSEYQREQNALPEDQRSPAKKADLMKTITGPESGVIIGLARNKFEGNVFKAANYVHLINEGVSIAQKQGAASEAAKLNAAASAAAPANAGRIATPAESMTPEEKAIAENNKRADEIAPNHAAAYVMPAQ